ncbi:MAG: hypothetical protein JWO68_2513 [Actinomycetia bacterium]|nr:hypothetical protein [Actinomycetes bacterium]
MHAAAGRRLALLVTAVLMVGASVGVAHWEHVAPGTQAAIPTRVARPDALTNQLLIGTLPRGALRSLATSTSKRHARSFLEAAVGSALGLVLLRRRRAADAVPVFQGPTRHLSQLMRAPPGALLTLS